MPPNFMRRRKIRPGRLVCLREWTKFPNEIGTLIEVNDLDASVKVLVASKLITLAMYDFEVVE